jgi:hypothetical protein
MAKWSPPNDVGVQEVIGRRLFEDSKLRGADGQPPFKGIQLNHFLEKRDREVSLDRLGRSNVESAVKKYLSLRASNAASSRKPPKTFNGWATVRAKELINEREGDKLPVFASPIVEEPPNDNDYHAHVVRPEAWSASIMALKLRHVFETYGAVERVAIVEASEAEGEEATTPPPFEDTGDPEPKKMIGEAPNDTAPADPAPDRMVNSLPKAALPPDAMGFFSVSADVIEAQPQDVPRDMRIMDDPETSARRLFWCPAISWLWKKLFGGRGAE